MLLCADSVNWCSDETENALNAVAAAFKKLTSLTEVVVTVPLEDVLRANDIPPSATQGLRLPPSCEATLLEVSHLRAMKGCSALVVSVLPSAGGSVVYSSLLRTLMHGWMWHM
jgi:hypothetical protein